MTTIKAHFDGRRIIPHEPVNLPIGHPVTLTILEIGPKIDPAELKKLAWQPPAVLNKVETLDSDASEKRPG